MAIPRPSCNTIQCARITPDLPARFSLLQSTHPTAPNAHQSPPRPLEDWSYEDNPTPSFSPRKWGAAAVPIF